MSPGTVEHHAWATISAIGMDFTRFRCMTADDAIRLPYGSFDRSTFDYCPFCGEAIE